MKLDNMKENNMKLIARSIVLTLVLALTFSTTMLAPAASAASEKYRSSADDSYIEQHVPSDYLGRIICAESFNGGVVAILRNDMLALFKDGRRFNPRTIDTTEDDFLVPVDSELPRLLCVVGNTFVYAVPEGFLPFLEDVAEYNFTGENWYAYGLSDEMLDYCCQNYIKFIDDCVDAVRTFNDHTFYRRLGYTYVVNASPSAATRVSGGYSDNHYIETIMLGNESFAYYCDQLSPTADDPDGAKAAAAFDAKYGIDFSVWGSSITALTVDDFIGYENTLLVNILHDFGDPFESNAEWTGYDNVSFCGLDGQIRFYYPLLTDPVQTISWSSYDASDEAEATLFRELEKYEHGEVDAVYETDDGAIETVYWCDGDCALFIDWYNKGDGYLTVSVYFY